MILKTRIRTFLEIRLSGNGVKVNYLSGYITDFINADSSCPAGYEPAFNYTFTGGINGCRCQFNGVILVLEGFCSQTLAENDCQDVDRQDAFTVHRWDSATKILCVKRATVNMINESSLSTHKQCGISQSSILVSSNESCPIVNITTTSPLLQQHYQRMSGWSGLILTSNATSPLSMESFPVGLLKVSQHKFCNFFQDLAITPPRNDYALAQTPRTNCTEAEQGEYQVFASQSQIAFFAANSQLQNLSQQLGYFPPGNYTYNLAFKNLPKWSVSCRYNSFPITDAVNYLTLKSDTAMIASTYGIIGLASLAFLFSFLVLVNIFFEEEKYSERLMVIINLILWFLLVVVMGFISGSNELLISKGNQAISQNCTSSYITTQIITPQIDLYSSLRIYIYLNLSLSAFLMLVHIGYCIYLIRKSSLTISQTDEKEKERVSSYDEQQPQVQDLYKKTIDYNRTMEMPVQQVEEEYRHYEDNSMVNLQESNQKDCILNREISVQRVQSRPSRQIRVKRKGRLAKIRNIIQQLKE